MGKQATGRQRHGSYELPTAALVRRETQAEAETQTERERARARASASAIASASDCESEICVFCPGGRADAAGYRDFV